jgi:adenine deaminase
MVTLNPAVQLGIDKRMGSIDVGKDADVVVWSAHPLSVYSHPEMTFVDGELLFDRQADIARRPQLEAERKQLEQAEPNRAPASAPPSAPPRRPAQTDDDGDGGDHR